MLNTPELRKKAKELGLTVTTPTKTKKRSRRYKTDKELMNEILRTPQQIRKARENILLKQLQNMIREGNKQINNYLNKQKKLLAK
jgi:Tfp pilus assembly PilM family ATPase